MVQPWDENKYNEERAAFFNRLNEYSGLGDNPHVVGAATELWDRFKVEGAWLNAGNPTNENWRETAKVDNYMNMLEYYKAFQISGKRWQDMQGQYAGNSAGFHEARVQEAERNRGHAGVWGKITPRAAADRAENRGDYILETTPGGKLFNGLNAGFAGWNSSPTLAYVWLKNSQTYAKNTAGSVQADVLEGIANNSVLTSTEWPVLREKIERGETPALNVHILELRHQSQDSNAWSLATAAGGRIAVHSQESFDMLPQARTDDPRYREMQNRWHQRNQRMDDADKVAIQAAVNDPNKVVVLSDPATENVWITNGQAAQIKRARENSATDIYHKNGSPETLNSYALLKVDAMLESVADQARRNSGGSQGNGLERFATQSSTSYGNNLENFSTEQSSGYGNSGFTPMNTQESAYPYRSFDPTYAQPAESPAAMSTWSGAQSYFPPVNTSYSSPRRESTYSGDQSFGAPLQRVNANDYAPQGNAGRGTAGSHAANYYQQQRGGPQNTGKGRRKG